jgi:signal transduction histidine kinase
VRNSSSAFRYAPAVLTAFAALFLRELLTPLLGSHDPYETVWLAVVFSAWYCGLGPSIVTTLLGALGVWYLFLPPRHSWIIQDRADVYGMLGFVFFSAAIIALGESNRRGVAVRSQAEEAIRAKEFSARLLKLQDEERRRIARELHDGAGQLLAAISMNAGTVEREKSKLSPRAAQCVEENASLIREVSADIRTISYLFHPPLLDEMGLDSALKWYVDGFSERSKIAAKLELPADSERLPRDHELCLFRIAQECLTNIHRHSGASTARVRLLRSPAEIKLEVSDDGKGIDYGARSKIASGESAGVGLRGMRERVRHLGGCVDIESNGIGTTVTATLPFGPSEHSVATPTDDRLESRTVLGDSRRNPSNTTLALSDEKSSPRAARA